jgi:hypothetical protein
MVDDSILSSVTKFRAHMTPRQWWALIEGQYRDDHTGAPRAINEGKVLCMILEAYPDNPELMAEVAARRLFGLYRWLTGNHQWDDAEVVLPLTPIAAVPPTVWNKISKVRRRNAKDKDKEPKSSGTRALLPPKGGDKRRHSTQWKKSQSNKGGESQDEAREDKGEKGKNFKKKGGASSAGKSQTGGNGAVSS